MSRFTKTGFHPSNWMENTSFWTDSLVFLPSCICPVLHTVTWAKSETVPLLVDSVRNLSGGGGVGGVGGGAKSISEKNIQTIFRKRFSPYDPTCSSCWKGYGGVQELRQQTCLHHSPSQPCPVFSIEFLGGAGFWPPPLVCHPHMVGGGEGRVHLRLLRSNIQLIGWLKPSCSTPCVTVQ